MYKLSHELRNIFPTFYSSFYNSHVISELQKSAKNPSDYKS